MGMLFDRSGGLEQDKTKIIVHIPKQQSSAEKKDIVPRPFIHLFESSAVHGNSFIFFQIYQQYCGTSSRASTCYLGGWDSASSYSTFFHSLIVSVRVSIAPVFADLSKFLSLNAI